MNFIVTTTYTNGDQIFEAENDVEADGGSTAQDVIRDYYRDLGYEVLGQFTRDPGDPGSAPVDGYMVYHPLMREASGRISNS